MATITKKGEEKLYEVAYQLRDEAINDYGLTPDDATELITRHKLSVTIPTELGTRIDVTFVLKPEEELNKLATLEKYESDVKKIQFLQEYEQLCRKHNMIVTNYGYDSGIFLEEITYGDTIRDHIEELISESELNRVIKDYAKICK